MKRLVAATAVLLFLSVSVSGAQDAASSRSVVQVIPQPPQSTAAFIKFDGIDGEAQDKDHENWIDVLSVKQSIGRSTPEGTDARRRGAPVVEDLSITKTVDKASPALASAHRKGKVFPKVEIHVATDSKKQTYMVYQLEKVRVTGYDTAGSGGDDRPTESVTLNFEKINVTYTHAERASGSRNGNVESSWKVEKGAR